MSSYHDAYGLADAETWLANALAERDAGTSCHFAIRESADGVHGVIGFEDIGTPDGQAMIGYWVSTPATGRGLATRAVRDALAWAQANPQIKLVWAIVAEPNAASRRVLEANRFHISRNSEPGFAGDPQLIYERPLNA